MKFLKNLLDRRWWRVQRMRLEFNTRMTLATRKVALGRWYVFRDEPSWLLLWLHTVSEGGQFSAVEAKLQDQGRSAEEIGLHRRVFEQAMTELELRKREMVKTMREAMQHAGLPQFIIDGCTVQTLEASFGRDELLGYVDPFEQARAARDGIADGSTHVRSVHVVMGPDGQSREVSAEEFTQIIAEAKADKTDKAASDAEAQKEK